MTQLQAIVLVVTALGGLSGAAALATVLVQRRKVKADTADVLTGTALELVQPLRDRLAEVEAEAAGLRAELVKVRQEAALLWTTLRRWRWNILDPAVSREQLRAMAMSEVGRNGDGH